MAVKIGAQTCGTIDHWKGSLNKGEGTYTSMHVVTGKLIKRKLLHYVREKKANAIINRPF
jgi:hypothetical protein